MPASTAPVPAGLPITQDSRVQLRALTVHPGAGGPLLECPQAKRFIQADGLTLAAVDAIRSTATLREAEAHLARSQGADVDLVAFAEDLGQRGFLASVDGQPCELGRRRGRTLILAQLPASRLQWMHHPATLALAALAAAAWVWQLAAEPAARPRYADLFPLRSPLLSSAVAVAAMLASTYLHELGHFLMARSFGVDATLSFSFQFVVVTLKTDVTGAWVLPPRRRICIFLAGIGINVVLASLAGLGLAAAEAGLLHVPHGGILGLRLALAANAIPLLFQLFVFAKTDLYYVLATLLGERNLAEASRSHLADRWRRLRGRGSADAHEPPVRLPRHGIHLAYGLGSILARLALLALAFGVGHPLLAGQFAAYYARFLEAVELADPIRVAENTILLALVWAQGAAALYLLVAGLSRDRPWKRFSRSA